MRLWRKVYSFLNLTGIEVIVLLIVLWVLSFLVSLLVFLILIPILRFFKVGQKIREEGPEDHFKKSGTPTMGGVGILLAVAILILIFVNLDLEPLLLALLLLFWGFGLIGFGDDFLKYKRESNQGLFGWQKFWLQVIFALIFSVFIVSQGHLVLPPMWLYLPFIIFIIVGSANAANLTDGLDGLLAGCAVIAFAVFAAISFKQGGASLASISTIASGTMLGFLKYNHHPAKIFMGDVGSLAIGALLAGVAILSGHEFLLILIALPFVLETLSVILQVLSFKIFKRRIFKMSPLHHHFELMGIPEREVVYGFWAFTLICGIISILLA